LIDELPGYGVWRYLGQWGVVRDPATIFAASGGVLEDMITLKIERK
jgi:hypothetical protein